MNMIAQMGLGSMQKGLERWGLDFEKQQADNMKRMDEDSDREHQQKVEKDVTQHKSEMRELLASLDEPS
jgi:hypothetical protein